jgi:DNA-binding response OmpR family regulator
MLTSALVTNENANVLMLESEEIVRQTKRLALLQEMTSGYIQQLGTQRLITIMAIVMIGLLILMIIGIYYHFLQRARLNEERNKMEREQLDFYTQVSHELRTPLTLIQGPLEELTETKEAKEASPETKGLYRILRRNTYELTDIINKMLDVQAKGLKSLSPVETYPDLKVMSAVEDTAAQLADDTQEPSLNETVLVVDDNPDIRAYLRTILQDKYQVSEAADGKQGLALANEIVPDLIVSDVMMPVMNGLEFCQRIKSGTATSHIPVILLTARALDHHQIEGYESGADAYITKPFSSELLLARINNLLKSRLKLKTLIAAASAPAEPAITDPFLIKFRDFIEKNLNDSELNVETIGAEFGLSRVQLYRKVKALTGQSPVELLRTTRLLKGRQLLQCSNKSVSEVAYEVGFSAPAYFTKCFKDEFGISPSDL